MVVHVFIDQVHEQDCLVWSILCCIFCCCITGIIAIVFSCGARQSFDRGWCTLELYLRLKSTISHLLHTCNTGDIDNGKRQARAAKICNIIGMVIGLLWIISISVAGSLGGLVVRYSYSYSYSYSYCYYYTSRSGYYYYTTRYC